MYTLVEMMKPPDSNIKVPTEILLKMIFSCFVFSICSGAVITTAETEILIFDQLDSFASLFFSSAVEQHIMLIQHVFYPRKHISFDEPCCASLNSSCSCSTSYLTNW